MATSVAKKAMWWTAGSAVIAGATLLVALRPQEADGSHNTTVTAEGTSNVVAGGNVTIQQLQKEVEGLTREQAAQVAGKYATVAPEAGRPAAYLVVDAPHHLWVRSSGTTTGHHVGAAYNGSTVWADCTVTTDFDPDRTDEVGPVWLRIHWPTAKPNDRLGNSQPGDRFDGWAYAGQTVPAGHNGAVPTCTNP